jgi:hypothetical protein
VNPLPVTRGLILKPQELAGRCLTEAVKQLALAGRVAKGSNRRLRLKTPEFAEVRAESQTHRGLNVEG